MRAPLLVMSRVSVRYADSEPVLREIDVALARGECLAVLGESGSGKSTLARAVLGLLPTSARRDGGFRFDGVEIDASTITALRGRRIALVFQDAAASLHPLRRIGVQLAEALRHANAKQEIAAALREVGLDAALEFQGRYPHQLSGGQRQRVMIALALAGSPELLIADEVTSALDPLAAQGVLDLLARLRRERGLAMLFISHDLHAVQRIADRVLLLRRGCVDALADCAAFFASPPSDYARQLLAASDIGESVPAALGETAIEAQGLAADYAKNPALREVSFSLARGAALGVIGASGSGKSTLARVLLALNRSAARRLQIAGADPSTLRGAARKAWRRRVQIVFQDPGSALDPRMTVAEALREPLQLHGLGDRAAQTARVNELLAAVQLDAALASRRPHELSGGQQQRVAIARALALDPDVLVCDEAVSALDPSVQAGILLLLRELRRTRHLSLVFISHDLHAVRALCEQVLVLERGRVVEQGSTHEVFAAPRHGHTQALVQAAFAITDSTRSG